MSQVSIIDIEGNHPQIPTQFDANIGFAIPIANVLEILGDFVAAGTTPVFTVGSGNTITTNVQITQAIAASNVANVGLAAFDSSAFGVDANGFVTLLGGGTATTNIDVDASTPPGTDPVVPNGLGNIVITGGQVAAGTVGANVIRTNSIAANTLTIEIQRSTAVAASASVNNGVSHYNSAQFTVDANGFVSLIGGGEALDSIGVDTTSGTGTNPVLPTLAGLITVNGATVVAGTNPIRTVSTAPNVYQIQVQISQALAAGDSTRIGLSNFSSTDFAVSADGFVTLSTTGAGKTITGNSGGALPPTANNWNIFAAAVAAGTTPAATAGAGSTLTVNIQRTQAIASTNAANVGLAAFDSAAFDVDANGFVQLNGGGIAATSFDVQANTAPGTDPVVPTAAGVVTINGAAVANHSVVLETRSRAANAYNLEIQYATSAAATDATKSGVAHFDSTDFSVDANGFVALAGAGAGQTITGDTGGALPPTAGNWNIVGGSALSAGTNASVTSGTGSTLTVTSINCAKWIVDATANRGTHTTIQAAITAASAGQTIFIRPGTYTEDLTLKAGVNLTAFGSNSSLDGTGSVIISGNATFNAAGTVTISGIQLQTNSAAFLTVSGSAASIVNLENCFLNCTNATGISFSVANTAARIYAFRCEGNLGTTGIGYHSSSSTGILLYDYCYFSNTGNSVTASTNSAGQVLFISSVANIAFSTSSTGVFLTSHSVINPGTLNITAITTAGTGILNQAFLSTISTGSASSISIGSGTTMAVHNNIIESSNTNAITGAGTISYSCLAFSATSSTINTTTKTVAGTIQGSKNTAPTAGFLGEQLTASATAVSLSNNTAKTITSVSLTPGIWDIDAMIFFQSTGIAAQVQAGISTTNNTQPAGNAGVNWGQYNANASQAIIQTVPATKVRATISATTTYYIVGTAVFSTGTMASNGMITATRVG